MGSEQNVRRRALATGHDVGEFEKGIFAFVFDSRSKTSPGVGSGFFSRKTACMVQSLFERLGGETRLRSIIDTFIDRVFADRMIGFFFRNADRARLKELEYQLTANFLGADVEYHGRALGRAHANHPIMCGHFARRRQILKETLEFYQVPKEIEEALLRHTDSLRPLITPETGTSCDPDLVRDRVKTG